MAKKCEYKFVRFGWDRVTGKVAEKGPADDTAIKDEVRKRDDDGRQLLQLVVDERRRSGESMVANGFELIFVREA